jgi:hypothetical protein
MLKIFLLILLWNYISSLSKSSSQVAYCGLAGFNGESANPLKLRLLHIWMNSRGKDSVGVSVNDKIYIGCDAKTLSSDSNSYNFQRRFEWPDIETSTVLMHTRAKTSGFAIKANAHPFGYKTSANEAIEDSPFDFIGMHNGVIRGKGHLAGKYRLKAEDYDVDSQLLLDVIFKYGPRCLSHYIGDAALAFYWTNNSDRLYLWKGASPSYTGSDKLTEERPLWFYYDKEDKGIYFCSEMDPLLAICNFKEIPQELPANKLCVFEKGILQESYAFTRKEASKYVATSHSNNNYYGRGGGGRRDTAVGKQNDQDSGVKSLPAASTVPNTRPTCDIESAKVVESRVYETNPVTKANSRVYYYDGLYHRNGHVIAEGKHLLDKFGNYSTTDGVKNPLRPYFFFRGYLMKDEESYNKAKEGNMVMSVDYKELIKLIKPNTIIRLDRKYWEITEEGQIICNGNLTNVPFSYYSFLYYGGVLKRLKEKIVDDTELELFNGFFDRKHTTRSSASLWFENYYSKGLAYDWKKSPAENANASIKVDEVYGNTPEWAKKIIEEANGCIDELNLEVNRLQQQYAEPLRNVENEEAATIVATLDSVEGCLGLMEEN